MDKIKLNLPSNPKYLPSLRLTASSLANTLEMDLDKIEDIKVLVSELYTYLLPSYDEVKVIFEVDKDKLNIVFDDMKAFNKLNTSDLDFELKKQILLALSDDLKIEKNSITIVVNK